MKRHPLSESDKEAIIDRYTVDLDSIIDIAKDYKKTRQAIYNVLWYAGVNTKKRLFLTTCTNCGILFERHKKQIKTKLHHFCSRKCYFEWLEKGRSNGVDSKYIRNRHSGVKARKIVSQYFELEKGYIVHHEDRNQGNNELSNLRVFASQGEHNRYHRGFDAKPIWSGVNE